MQFDDDAKHRQSWKLRPHFVLGLLKASLQIGNTFKRLYILFIVTTCAFLTLDSITLAPDSQYLQLSYTVDCRWTQGLSSNQSYTIPLLLLLSKAVSIFPVQRHSLTSYSQWYFQISHTGTSVLLSIYLHWESIITVVCRIAIILLHSKHYPDRKLATPWLRANYHKLHTHLAVGVNCTWQPVTHATEQSILALFVQVSVNERTNSDNRIATIIKSHDHSSIKLIQKCIKRLTNA